MYIKRASLVAQLIKNPPAMQETWFNSWVGKIPWRKFRPPIPVFLGFPGGSTGKESACIRGDLSLIPRLERSPGGGHGNSPRYSCLDNPHRKRSLVGYNPWALKESNMTAQLSTVPPLYFSHLRIFATPKGLCHSKLRNNIQKFPNMEVLYH